MNEQQYQENIGSITGYEADIAFSSITFWPELELKFNKMYGDRKWHCDDILESSEAPGCVLDFLNIVRSHNENTMLQPPDLYAVYNGIPCRVTTASKYGDVGICFDLKQTQGYDKRVLLIELTDFKTSSQKS
jgi:hypothetical protein